MADSTTRILFFNLSSFLGRAHGIAHFRNVFLFAAFTFSINFLFAQTTTWTNGGGDFVWTNAANWSNGVPANGYDVVFNGSTGSAITSVTGGLTLSSISVSGSDVSLSGNGNITMNISNSLTIASGITLRLGNGNSTRFTTFTLNSGSTSTINGTVFIDASVSSRTFVNSGDLTMGASAVITSTNNNARFTLSSGATLRIASLNGITSSGASGNIQVLGTRTYSTGANYVYNGVGTQTVGNGLPATSASLTVSNTGGSGSNTVSLVSGITITNALTVSNGIFSLGSNNVTSVGSVSMTGTTISGTGSMTLAGNVTTNSSPSTATISVPVNLGASNRTFTIANGGLTSDLLVSSIISGTGGLIKAGTGSLTLSGTNTYSGGTTLNTGTLNINSSSAVGTGTFTINGGTIDNTSGSAITLGVIPQTWNGDFIFSGSQNLNLGTGTVTLGSSRTLIVSANTLTVGGVVSGSSFDLNKGGAGTLSFGSSNVNLDDLSVSSGTLTSTSGTLSISGSFTNSGTFNNNSGTVNYNGSSTQSVTNVTYNNLTLSGTGQKDATTTVTVSGNLNNSTTFDLASNSLSVSGTITNTSGTLRFAGASNGLAVGSGTVEYYGSVAQSVAAGTYNNLTLSGAGQKNAAGALVVSTTFTNSAVLDMASNSLTASGSTDNASGTIKFSGASNGLAISTGTIEYYGASQNVTSGTYSNLTINQSAGNALLVGATTVNGTLSLNSGNLILGSNNLLIGSAGSISVSSPSASKMIVASGSGEVRKSFTGVGAFTFPVGDNTGTVEYSPITVNVTSGSFSSAYVGVSIVNSKHPNNSSASNYLNRYWNVTQSGISSCVATISASYVNADVVGTETSIKSAQLNGVFNATTNPWVKFSSLGSNLLTITNGSFTSGITSACTGITGADPSISISGGDVTICNGTSVNLSASVTGGDSPFSYSWSPSTGLSSTSISNPVANPSSTTTYTLTVRDVNGITSSKTTTITVNPVPDAAAANKGICSGAAAGVGITNPNAVAGTTFSWTVSSSSNVSGAAAGSGATINDVLASTDGINTGTVTYTVTPTANGCNGSTVNVTVTVNPVPVVTNTAAQLQTTICSATALNFTPASSVSGTSYSWTSTNTGSLSGVSGAGTGAITDTPTNTGSTSQQITYTITPTVGACNGTAVNYVVTVSPVPDAAAANKGICSGAAAGVGITNPNAVAGTTFSWTVSSSSNVSGAAAGSGATINDVLASTDGINTGTVTYTVTPTANGCNGSTVNVTVTVNPVPVVTNTAAQLQTTICSNTSLNFAPTSSVSGTAYSWTSTNTGSLTGVSASGTGSVTDTPVNSSNTVQQITYTITPTVGACSGTAVNYVVTVDPVPDAAAANKGICSGAAAGVGITNPNAVAGTTFSWTVNSSSNVSGAAAGSGATINDVLASTDGINTGTVTYTVTPTANGCNGSTVNVTVTVNPVPVVTNTAAQLQTTICSNTSLNFAPTSSVSGTAYSWTSTDTGSLTGVSASGTGSVTDTPVNSSSTVQQITYTITPTVGACSGTAVNYVVTVDPVPDAAAANKGICSGAAAGVGITNPNAVAGTTFSWTVNSSSNVSGAAAGSGATINDVLASTDGINTGTVTYTVTPTANGCNGSTVNVTVTVNPVPVVTNTAAQLQTTICSNTSLNFAPTSSVSGTAYSWTSTNTGSLTGVSASGTGSVTDTPVNSSSTVQQITYTITPTVGACSGTAVNYVVTVNPVPDAAAANKGICSGAAAGVGITNPNAVAGTTFSWTVNSSSNVSGAAAGSGATINDVLASTDGINTGTVTYTVTPTANGCNGSTVNVTVTVNPVPVVTNTAAQLQTTICSNTSLNFAPTSSVSGTAYSWTSTDTGSLSGVSATGTGSVTDTPVNSSSTVQQITYTITPTVGACSGTAVNYVVTVNPVPNAAAVNKSICSGTAAGVGITNPNAVSGTTFSWTISSSSNVSGAAAGSGATINDVLASTDGINTGTVTYTVTPTANGCNGSTVNVTVTVNPVPVVTNTAAQLQTTICSNTSLNFAPTSSVSGTAYSWTSTDTGSLSGVSATGTGSVTDTPVNSSSTVQQITYTITPTVGTCSGTAVNYVVTVSPVPDAAAANKGICSGAAAGVGITNPNAVAGTTFSWTVNSNSNVSGAAAGSGATINDVLASTDGINTGTVTYTVTPTANGCNGSTINVTVTVNPVPVVTNTAAQLQTTICSNTSLNFTPASSVTGTTYSWTSTNTGSLSGVSASGTGAITDTPVNSSSTSQQITYTITPTVGTCSGTAVNYVVTVNPVPDAAAANKGICSGAAAGVGITNPNAVAGTTFSWTISSNSNVSGAAAGSGATINDVLASTDGINTGTVTYTVTPTANGCNGSTINVTVTVNPVPVVTNTAAQLQTTICSNTSLNFTPASSVTGTTYSWTSTNTGSLSGVSASGTGAITDTPVNSSSTSQQITYTITPTVGTCSGTAVNYVVTVNPVPDAAAANKGICSGAAAGVGITNPNAVAGTTFSWTISSSSNVSGAAAGSGATINDVLASTDGINTGTVTYTVTPTANGCNGSTINVTVTVNPVPVVTNTAAQLQTTICSNTSLNFTPASSVTGTTYSWTSTNTGSLSGVSASGTGAITDTPVNSSSTSQQITYTITPTVGTCSGTAVNYVVTVNPVPDAAASNKSICSGAAAGVGITNPNAVAGTTFIWTVNSSSNVSGAAAGSGATINDVLASTDGINTGTVTYTVTPTANGCNGSTINVTVTVNPVPVVTNTAAQLQTTICSNTSLNFTPASSVSGTAYSWTSTNTGSLSGVSATGTGSVTDTPVNSSSTSQQITYTITPTVGTCSGTAVNYVVTVSPVPDAAAANKGICSGAAAGVGITNPNAVAGTTFSWTVNSSSNVSGAAAGSGATINDVLASTDGINTGTVTYTVTPTANGCNGSTVNVTVTVNPVPVVTNTAAQLQTTICSNTSLNFTPASSVTGTTYSWTSTNTGSLSGVSASGTGAITDTPVNSSSTSQQITYTITPTVGTCSGTAVNYVVTVSPVPDAAAANKGICSGAAAGVGITNPNAVAGTTFSWTVNSSSNVSGAAAGSGATINDVLSSTDGINTGTVTYTVTPTANGCNGSTVNVTVTVNPVPVVTNTAAQLQTTICSNTSLNFTPASSVAGTTYIWTTSTSSPSTVLNFSASGSGVIVDSPKNTGNTIETITYNITPSVGGCAGLQKDYVVTVNPVPTASGTNATICSGQSTNISINAGPNNVAGTTFTWSVTATSNVSGAFSDNGSTIIQSLSLTDSNVGTVTYHITPTANNCSNPVSTDIVVTVNPIVTVDAGVDYPVCEPTSFVVTGTIGGAATTATWSVVSGSSIGPLATTVSGNVVTAIYTPGASDVGTTVTFKLETNDPDAGGPCSLATDFLNVAINRAAAITSFPADISVCEPATVPLSASIGGGATKGTWSIYNNSGQGNLLASNVSGTTVTSTYQVASADITNVVTFQLQTDDPDGSGPCPVVSQNYNVKIDMAAKAIAPATLSICSDNPSINLGGSIGGSAATALWTGGTGSYDDSSNPSATYTISSSETPSVGGTPIQVTFTLTAYPSGSPSCTSVSAQTVLTINPLPNVGFTISGVSGANNNMANNDPPATLNGFQSGGVFTSLPTSAPINLVTNTPFDVATFDPSVAPTYPPVRNQVTYTYTDANNCTNSVTQQITVTPVAIITFYLRKPDGSFLSQDLTKNYGEYNYEVCQDVGLITLDGQPFNPNDSYTRFDIQPSDGSTIPNLSQHLNYAGGIWTLNTNGLPYGSYDITYYYRDVNGTPPPKVRTLDVYISPIAKVDLSSTCVVNSVKLNDATLSVENKDQFGSDINSWAWVINSNGTLIYKYNQFDSVKFNIDEPGQKDITLTVGTNHACFSKKDTAITVGDYPIPDFAWSNICTFDLTNFESRTTFGSGVGGTIIRYDWDFKDGSPLHSVTIDTAVHKYGQNGTYNVKLTVTTDVGCVVSKAKPVDILVTTNSGSQVPPPTPIAPYWERFNSTDGGWIPQAFNATNSTSTNIIPSQLSWVWGQPSNNFQPYQSSAGWWTGGNSQNYFDFESSAVNGPCFDLTQLNRPMIALDYWVDANENYDGAVLQYSVDGGLNWEIVGPLSGTPVAQRNQGINWYNPGATIVGNPGGQSSGPYGWTGKSQNWLNARFNLDILPTDSITINGSRQAERKQVRMRIAFASNGPAAGSASYGGFAFDNVFVGEKTRNVLIEHFTNAVDYTKRTSSYKADSTLLKRHATQRLLHGGISDFIDIQYHTRFPKPDVFDGPISGEISSRALFYQTQRAPYSVVDGNPNVQPLSGLPTGDYRQLTDIEIDRRALVDPEFSISKFKTLSLLPKTDTTSLINVSFVAKPNSSSTVNYPIIANVALIEKTVDTVVVSDPTQSATYHNVVRKLLFGGEGMIVNNPADSVFTSGELILNTSIANKDSLLLVAFVQNFYTKEVLQSAVIKSPPKTVSIVTAVEKTVLSAEDILIYPNPASGAFNFALPGDFPSGCLWKLSDQRGINVLSGNFEDAFNGRKEVKISGMTNGLYIIAIVQPGQPPVYKKLMILNSD